MCGPWGEKKFKKGKDKVEELRITECRRRPAKTFLGRGGQIDITKEKGNPQSETTIKRPDALTWGEFWGSWVEMHV